MIRKSLKTAATACALIASVDAQDKVYKSGEVKTWDKFLYGKFRVSMAGNHKKGTVSSFFTFWEEEPFTEAEWNEIDIELVPSVESTPLFFNLIYAWKAEESYYVPDFNPTD